MTVTPLRIGIDLDGVLADMDSALVHHAEVLFGESKMQHQWCAAEDLHKDAADGRESTEPAAGVLSRLASRQQRRLWRHVESIENFWEGLGEIETGSVHDLAAAATEHRWEITFLTRRPQTAGATAQLQSQRWLAGKGFTLPSVCVGPGSRGVIASALALDIVVDDRPQNCLHVVGGSKARAILLWRGDPKQLPAAVWRPQIRIMRSFGECLESLRQESTVPDRPRAMSRALRMLGLREAPAR